jgi:tetratricopeptide (TPR) repeat protein
MLTGAIDAREGRAEAGLSRILAAATRYESLPYDFGPPVTFKPPRELAGEILLQQHRPKEALAEFDLALKMAPRRALSMLGRARALAAMGDASAARKAYAELAAMWRRADPDLPELQEARAGGTK